MIPTMLVNWIGVKPPTQGNNLRKKKEIVFYIIF